MREPNAEQLQCAAEDVRLWESGFDSLASVLSEMAIRCGVNETHLRMGFVGAGAMDEGAQEYFAHSLDLAAELVRGVHPPAGLFLFDGATLGDWFGVECAYDVLGWELDPLFTRPN